MLRLHFGRRERPRRRRERKRERRPNSGCGRFCRTATASTTGTTAQLLLPLTEANNTQSLHITPPILLYCQVSPPQQVVVNRYRIYGKLDGSCCFPSRRAIYISTAVQHEFQTDLRTPVMTMITMITLSERPRTRHDSGRLVAMVSRRRPVTGLRAQSLPDDAACGGPNAGRSAPPSISSVRGRAATGWPADGQGRPGGALAPNQGRLTKELPAIWHGPNGGPFGPVGRTRTQGSAMLRYAPGAIEQMAGTDRAPDVSNSSPVARSHCGFEEGKEKKETDNFATGALGTSRRSEKDGIPNWRRLLNEPSST
uniref:Uncharacterized protein n=1 Tax=Trichuris muris TaxID=70415 RepID=A0A5S6QBK7_TRIMR